MRVTICIGSSCHLKGSKKLVERLQHLVNENQLGAKVELGGAFCMGKCGEEGVRVSIGDEVFSVEPDKAEEFFKNEILPRI